MRPDPFRAIRVDGYHRAARSKVAALVALLPPSVHPGVAIDAVSGRSRARAVVEVRHAIAWYLVAVWGMSLPRAAGALGGLDHTTVLNAVRVVEGELQLGRGRRSEPVMAMFEDACRRAALEVDHGRG